jgi:hypothetical protein
VKGRRATVSFHLPAEPWPLLVALPISTTTVSGSTPVPISTSGSVSQSATQSGSIPASVSFPKLKNPNSTVPASNSASTLAPHHDSEQVWKPETKLFSLEALSQDGGLDAAVASLHATIQDRSQAVQSPKNQTKRKRRQSHAAQAEVEATPTSTPSLSAIITALSDLQSPTLPLLLSRRCLFYT